VTALVPIHHAWIDASGAPLYVLTFPASTADEQLIACCEARETWAARVNYPVAWVVDLSAIRTATARQRQIFGKHLGRMERHNITYNQGAALIVPNAALRGIVTAIFWIKPPRFHYRLFATRREGVEWAAERLREGRPGAELPRRD
jgi:hypothetical protein